MAGRKKKKTSSSKKNKSHCKSDNNTDFSNNCKKPTTLEEVLSQAEWAMEMSHVESALELFSYAAGVLRSRIHAPTVGGSSNAGKHGHDQDNKALSTVLGKMGELKASTGDVEAARSDLLDAIELLGPAPKIAAETSSGDNKMKSGGEKCNINMAQNTESRAGLHLYLGQLSSGREALASFRVGVGELEKTVCVLEGNYDAVDDMDDVKIEGSEEPGLVDVKLFIAETRIQLCAAHCSIAELYLTDLCEDPDAESSCEEALKSALSLDKVSYANASTENGNDSRNLGLPPPDALQTMANFRLSQSRVHDALECILKAYERMKVGCEALSALVGLVKGNSRTGDVDMDSKACELVEVDAASSLPGYNFRCQTAKIMLECTSLLKNDDFAPKGVINQCAESAIQVLGSLLAENDEVIEVWHLLGCAFMACTPPNPESANFYWEHALKMLIKVKEGLEQSISDSNNDDDRYNENELEAVEFQIIDVKLKLGKYDGSEGEKDEEMKDA